MVQLSHSYSVTTVCSGLEATAMSVCRPESFARPSGTNILASQILDQQPLNIIWTIFHGQGSRAEIQTVALVLSVHVLQEPQRPRGETPRRGQSQWLTLEMCPAFIPPPHITWKSLFRKSLCGVPDCSAPTQVTLWIYRGPLGTWSVHNLTHSSLGHSYCIAGSTVCKTARGLLLGQRALF